MTATTALRIIINLALIVVAVRLAIKYRHEWQRPLLAGLVIVYAVWTLINLLFR
jgi:hypothetical protein